MFITHRFNASGYDLVYEKEMISLAGRSRKFFNKCNWNKKLAAAITAGLLSGFCATGAFAAEYDRSLTGSANDASWLNAGNSVTQSADGTIVYNFVGDNTFTVHGDNVDVLSFGSDVMAMDPQEQKIVINTRSGNLKINANTPTVQYNNYANGIALDNGDDVTINGNVDINVHGGSFSANGISVNRAGASEGQEFTHLTINGNVTMRNTADAANPWGVTSATIHGGYGQDGWVTDAPNYSGSRWAPTGIYLGMTGGSRIDINGNVDLAVKGSAVVTDPYYKSSGIANAHDLAIINLNGGKIKIETPEDKTESYYALANYGGTINVNMNGKAAGTNDVNIKGNIIAMKEHNGSGGDYYYRNGQINLALTTAGSSWTGVADNVGANYAGDVNLYLQNGAVWNHQAMSKTNGMDAENMPAPSNQGHYGRYDKVSHIAAFTGGAGAAGAGYIVQKDAAKISIDNYSGNAVVVYEHNGDGTTTDKYAAGDTIINHAKVGSGITLSTDNSGITMSDDSMVKSVLNALAGKLTYMEYINGIKNLAGKVRIADGLTSSSASLKIGEIAFDSGTGKGSYDDTSAPVPGEKTEFTTQITGDKAIDTEYVGAGVLVNEGEYVFTKDSTITTSGSGVAGAAVNIQKPVKINAANSVLNLNGRNYGISQNSEEGAEITAKELNITATSDRRVEGIHIGGQGTGPNDMNLVINGNTNINAQGRGYTLGIYTAGAGKLIVNGNLAMKGKDGSWGVDNNGTGGLGYYSISGIYAGSNYSIQKGSHVIVNGNLDLAVNGTGILANGGGAKVDINGGGTILTNKANSGHYALISQSGHINMNLKKDGAGNITGAGDNTVKIYGNLGVMNGSVHPNEPDKTTDINLGLGTNDSELYGVITNNFTDRQIADGWTGKVNLYMSNGASWYNEAYGTTYSKFKGSTVENFVGSSDAASAGNIFQKDVHALTFNNYSGYANVYYAHKNSGENTADYTAGDTIVKKAAANSGIKLITDNSGIAMSNTVQVNNVLNTLAGKLVYSEYADGIKNLSGKVQIADGLTSSSASLGVGDVDFDSTTGRGSSSGVKPAIPDHQTTVDFTSQITGNKAKDVEYVYGGVLKDNGRYVFEKNSNITITGDAQGAINAEQNVAVDAGGSTLNLVNSGSRYVYGINNTVNSTDSVGKDVTVTADKVNINVNSSARAEGIHMNSANKDMAANTTINGAVAINANGSGAAMGAYVAGNSKLTINGSVAMKGAGADKWGVDDKGKGFQYYGSSGLYAGSNYAIQKGGYIDVNGKVDMQVNGNGAFANGGGSRIDIDGGSITVNSGRQVYALLAQSGTVNMNMNDRFDGAGTSDVNIKGNLGVLNGSVSSREPEKDSVINLGLSTKKSSWTGVIDYYFTEANKQNGFDGKVNLYMSNGAVWTNEAYGQTSGAFAGSIVENFAGSSDAASAGYIVQKDSKKLKINNYSGHAVIVYEHTGDGSKVQDYKAGDTVIGSAKAGSGITMSTDNTGVDMNSNDAVESTLNALAQKLTYSGFVTGENNLDGKVQIADGLTASSASKYVGQMGFDANNGKGNYVVGSVKPGVGGSIVIGGYESDIMKGSRSVAMSSMLAWRDIASEIYSRAAAVRDGAEKGAWARTYGGKTKYDGNTHFEESYWAGQVGYDRGLKNGWTVGAAVDYRDGNATYLNGGKGDDKVYSLGIYASKDLGDNRYLDLAAKVGRVENEYTVYNIASTSLKGDYKTCAYSLSAQYSKRFGDVEKGYLEPQVQFTWAHLAGKNYDAHSNKGDVMNIKQEAFNSLVGRVGLKTGIENQRGGLYAGLSLAHEFAGDVKASYNANDGGLKSTKYDFGDTWSELTLGGSYRLSRCADFYADITRSLSGNYQHKWKLSAGVNFSF